MKKLFLTLAGGLIATVAMAHIVMNLYHTIGEYEPYIDVKTYYLDDIKSIELFDNSDDPEHLGQNGILINLKANNSIKYYTSDFDSIVWIDYVDPGFAPHDITFAEKREPGDQMDSLYRSMNCFSDIDGVLNWDIFPLVTVHALPTLDVQTFGANTVFCAQNYAEDRTNLPDIWTICYNVIFRSNRLIEALQLTNVIDDELREIYIAEARTIRAIYYIQLANIFGRVPIFDTGEEHATCGTQRVRVESHAEMWDYIINDLLLASEVLDWTPRQAIRTIGNNGTMNKGIALSYLGDAYMWKAHRCPEVAAECYQLAAQALGRVIYEGPYELNPSFATLWDAIPQDASFDRNKETILVQILEDGYWTDNVPVHQTQFLAAPICTGGWGSFALSWEWYASFEQGDKRRDASCATYALSDEVLTQYGMQGSSVTRGYNPYLKEEITPSSAPQFKENPGDIMPTIWSMKWWHNSRADWTTYPWAAVNIYWKRLANVMLDYAECLFNIGREPEAWEIIDQLRNRAFGNLEVGRSAEIEAEYLPELNRIFRRDYNFTHDVYPLPLSSAKVEVPDAQTYYTALKEQKGYDSPVWKVAVNEERRKEFNAEWSLRPDMERSGYMQDHIEHNYPKGNEEQIENLDFPWTIRLFDYDPQKAVFPIPLEELRRNDACDQNEGY